MSHRLQLRRQFSEFQRHSGAYLRLLLLLLATLAFAACGRAEPTPGSFTAVPTYTPTPAGVVQLPVAQSDAAIPAPTPEPPTPPPAEPPTATFTPLPPTPTETPTPPPTETPRPTETPTSTPTPTQTPTVTPTATPDYAFVLEASGQFPTQVSDVDEVRIYLYVYAEATVALEGYTLYVLKDGEPLTVQAQSTGGLPGETRPGPSPYTRFADLGTAFFEQPAGIWQVQLLDPERVPAGPPVTFTLGEDDPLRELYLRYRQKE